MDGDSGEDTPSDSGSDLASPASPRDKRFPMYNNAERDRSDEVAASWSYMPQSANAGMPRVRPQQPALQEASGLGPKLTPLSFGTSTATTSSTSGSFGDTTPRHKKHKHRPKDELTASDLSSTTKSPLSALTFGSPRGSISPPVEGMEALSINDQQQQQPQSARGPVIEVRVRTTPKKEQEQQSASQEKTENTTTEEK